ncbi:WS/DGAT/MGAT family O-acyltransferase [Actinospongicola halichondriae]|uniref:WS/DGAT/MGAT family O-acyltransferase n=1 Tax=Actinospongicola halichondriae TaxID=3236844 RepID=UPI003D559652
MERLSGLDTTFLTFETPSVHMHVAQTAIFDTSTVPGGYEFSKIKDHIRSRLHLVPPFRRRVVEVPLNLHHPLWVEDPDFDLDYHVRRVGVPAPGGLEDLSELAGRIASRPLDRSRPLWEAYVCEGMQNGWIGVITKMHHCAVDGVSGAELMASLFDLSPDGGDIEPPDDREPERVPSDGELIAYALNSRAKSAMKLFPLLGETVSTAANLVQRHRDPDTIVGAVPLTAPPTPWNAAITPHRKVSFAKVELDDVKALKNHYGVTVNDIVLALMGGTLRRYLESKDALPPEPLIAVCPVSVRTDDETGTTNNRVSAMFTTLATHLDSPAARVARIHETTKGAKDDHHAVGANFLTDWAEYAAPRTFALASRLYSQLNLADRHRPIHNVVISNVPGPPMPLYYGGAELVAAYPMGPIMEGAGLNITVMSYRDRVDIGFMACRELVPDVWDLPAHVGAALAELQADAGLTSAKKKAAPAKKRAAPKKKAVAKKRTAKKAATKKRT